MALYDCRFFTSLIVWLFLLAITALSVGSTIFLWLEYDSRQKRNQPVGFYYRGAVAATVGTVG